jgi:hypothetical protein
MRRSQQIILLFGILLLILHLIPISSAGSNANIVITDVTPTNLSPGDTAEITLMIKNDGSRDARHITLNFQNTDDVAIIGSSTSYIHSINAWCSKEITIPVHVAEDTSDGAYKLPISTTFDEYYYTADQGYVTTPMSSTLGIVFYIKGEIIIGVADVTTDPSEVRPGDNYVTLTATLSNSGGGRAKDLKAELLCPEGFKPSTSATNIYYVGVLNSGSQSQATFHIDVDDGLDDGYHLLPVTMAYKDTNNNEYTITKEVRLLIKPKPEFEIVSSHTEPQDIGSKDHVLLHITIKNIGSEKAESVSLRSTGEAEVPFDFDVKSDYIGNLEIGEAGEAVLEFDVDEDPTPKSYQQGLEIRCTGDRDLGDYNVYLFDKMIPISVTSSSSGHVSVPGFEGLSALIALFVFFALFLRRER